MPSIAAVSIVTITSKQKEAAQGYKLRIEQGQPGLPEEAGARDGTIVLVERLFYNAPARKKFLKSSRWEVGLISDCLQKLALSHPDIAFKLMQGSKTLFFSPGNGDLAAAVQAIYGQEALISFTALNHDVEDLRICGFTSLPEFNRADRSHYIFFVNKRWIKSRELNAMVDEAYFTLLPKGRYPLVVLNLELPQHSIDVNVHPAKLEIKFQQAQQVKEAVLCAIRQALLHKEALAPRLIAPPPQGAALPVDPQTGFIRPPVSKPQRLRESHGQALDGKTLAERLYGGRISEPQPSVATARSSVEQRLDFNSSITDGANKDPVADSAYNLQAPELKPLIYSELRVLGQADASYIVATGEDGVYFIDQHAAHERVLYEQISAQAQSAGGESRMLALPQTMQLTVGEHILLTENILNLSELGFILEHFGENTYVIRGVPLWYEGQDAEGLLRSVLAGQGNNRLRREEIFMAACKQAIKANRRLNAADISSLLAALDKCQNSATCPHGRPVAVKIPYAEIRKRFLR